MTPAPIVQKFGGTSVGSVERLQAVAQRVAATAKSAPVVVVVSAMGKTTDTLVGLASQITDSPSRREMDMLLSTGEQVSIALLSMALQELGQPAVSMTGAQVGIVTEAEYARARILQISTDRLQRQLDEGKVVVVAGFQGMASGGELEITTLGRGGSDTSAVALASALNADRCEIYTDVPGILTTDPRIVPNAQLMAEVTCNEMLELASLGAKVLHPRAVEIARNYGVPMVVRSSWTDAGGTHIVAPPRRDRELAGLELVHPVDAVELSADEAKISFVRVPDSPGVAAKLFGELGRRDLDLDLIVQSIHEGNTNDIAFTVKAKDADRAEAVAREIVPKLCGGESGAVDDRDVEVKVQREIAKISIVGAGMIGRPGVAAQMFSALAEAGISIQTISTSEVKVSCTIDRADGDRAVAILCKAFQVENSPVREAADEDAPSVRGIALARNQAQLSVLNIPDRAGMAAKIFAALAEANLSVYTIVQSERVRLLEGVPTRDLSFAVNAEDADAAMASLEAIATQVGYSEVKLARDMAKISIVGAGMATASGVAAAMFAALADRKINIQAIATSEIKTSCTIDDNRAIEALQAVHTAFGLDGDEPIEVPSPR
ncbi:MAG: aspartate kinase [Geitlerinemataceae cyanobacterium]